MPSWEQHCAHLERKPYDAWYFIDYCGNLVGNIYLTSANEIGIHISPLWQGQGIGGEAIDQLVDKHPRPYYLANIAPTNPGSIKFFERLGYTKIQHTYRLDYEA